MTGDADFFAQPASLAYGEEVMQSALRLLLVVVLGCGPMTLFAQDQSRRELIFDSTNAEGEVWVNVSLTRQRFDEDYLPMVVMVANRIDGPVVLDRESFRLIGADGQRYPMPSLKELRAGYNRFGLDARAVSGSGIPWEVWARERRLVESNFFPNLTGNSRALVIDEVSLMPGNAVIDLLYFAKPQGFAAGQPLVLEVHAMGWAAPLRLGMVLN
jgi:hypothetical protein